MNFSPGSSSGKEGLELMKNIRDIHPNAVVIFITAYGDMDLVIKAIREGATDFIQKPWNDQKLLATVRSAMELSKSRQEVVDLREKQHHLQTSQHKDYQMVWGTSGIMETIMETVDKVAGTDASVIILGENGTGKELMAREIHLRSTRREEVFIKVDLGSLSESLFESELFGHVKGAFTDAHMDKPGRFELASGGTLFLDEIANISTALQTKLLTVIENREVTKLGSNLSKAIDARIISATNMKLDQMVHNGTFREDLLYRLNTITIDIPPLRERMDDLPQLIDFFLGRLGEKYGRETGISRGAIAQLAKHTWPGNIRELKYTLEKAVIMADHAILTERDFLLKSSPVSPEGIRMVNLKQNEREIIKKAIQLNGGNLSQAARHLGISRRTLYNKIRKYEI
jgi:two-component system, NtrC family, response regulator HydG